MSTSRSSDDLVFNYRTLRLIIGALAFAFPAMVIALTGKITTSISASYHEVPTRDVFVGFLFVIGALLISYKGHVQEQAQGEQRTFLQRVWDWLKTHQEDVVSSIGGMAAIFTALNPTACDGCSMDTKALIHSSGAFVLFSTVVYFSLIAFLRSLNGKLLGYAELKDNNAFLEQIQTLRQNTSRQDVNLLKQLWNTVTREMQIFLAITAAEYRRYDREKGLVRIARLLRAHDKKIARGIVYVVCGSLIAVTLLAFILLLLAGKAAQTTTFIVETIALVLFGIAWMTASKLEYITTLLNWWRTRQEKTATVTQPEAA
jgi:hypothetical protein